MKKLNLLTLVILFFTANLFSQSQPLKKVDWTKMGNNPNATFYEVVSDFNNYWKDKTIGKGKGIKPFKRWAAEMEAKVYPTGNMNLTQNDYQHYLDWQKTQTAIGTQNRSALSPAVVSNWTALGPVGSPSGPSPYSRTGAGRLNFLRFDPTNTATMYVGAADGGLWKSTDSGTTWTTNTDFLAVIGCSDLCINPTNTQIMYLATGDVESDRNSAGVLKSTDGGTTWTSTSLVFNQSQNYRITKMLMDPNNPLIMIVSTSLGVYKTTDGWATNTQTLTTGEFTDMEFKPGDANTVYIAGSTFYKSTDKGDNWTEITAGLPASDVRRIALGVTAGNSAYVYALIGKDSDNGFLGMYRSTDSGTTFNTQATTPNVLGWQTNGSDAGGQAFYDLAITVSPTDANIVTTGGVNHWQSTDGGVNWVNKSYWAAGQVHADIHELSYLPSSSNTIFSCNDGGLHKSTDNGTTWTDISNNLNITQIVKLGLSTNNANTVVIGAQDNGTSLKTGTSWGNIRGGDGGECFIDYTDNNIVYTQYVQGAFARQNISEGTETAITTGLPTPLKDYFDFYSKWDMDPVDHNRLYAGGSVILYTSANQGNIWTALGTPSGTGSIKDFAIAPSNTATIYCVKKNAISVSTNSGTSFTNKTGTLPVGSAALSSVTVSNTDPLKVWVTFSGYSAGNKVFKSTDGGTTWTNVSAGLPNLPMNTIVYTNNTTNDAVYVGGSIGVYYMDNGTGLFATYNVNLPNVQIKDLEIYYPTLKLRAATYGRGAWESPLNITGIDIAASAGSNGSISPEGTVSVITGANQTFTITPTCSSSIATVLVDGVNNPAAVASGTYTFSNVSTTHTISATFTAPNIVATTTCIPPATPANLGNYQAGPQKVVLGTINNTSVVSNAGNSNRVFYDYTVAPYPCQTGYSTNLVVASNPQSITLRCTQNNQKFSVWIDYNNNTTFETDELVVTDELVMINTDTPFQFSIPATGVTLNTPLRMRVIGDTADNSSTSCGERNHGQVEDYQVTISTTLATDTIEAEKLFNYFPNPTTGILNLSYSNAIESVKVTNILGQIIFKKNINANTTQIDMSHLTAGTYFIEITAGDVSKTIKVVKK